MGEAQIVRIGNIPSLLPLMDISAGLTSMFCHLMNQTVMHNAVLR